MPEPIDAEPSPASAGSPDPLEAWLQLRGRTEAELRRWLAGDALQVDTGVSYQGLEGVVHLHNPSVSGVHLYCREERLRLLYLSDPGALEGLDVEALGRRFGSAGHLLASRAGPEARLVVYPEAGVAWSMGPSGLHFLEAFPPTTLEGYQQEIYRRPGRALR